MATEAMVSGPLPVSVSVTELAARVHTQHTLWLPNAMLGALKVAAGLPMPLPLSVTVWVEPVTFPVLSVITSDAA